MFDDKGCLQVQASVLAEFYHLKVSDILVLPFLCTFHQESAALLAAIQKEIQRHDLSYFVDEPPPVAQGGRGVVVAGCPACRKRINTISQFLDHLTKDAMPPLIERLSSSAD